MSETLPPYRRPWREVVRDLGVDPATGLGADEAEARLRRFGPNELRRHKPRSAWVILWDQLKSPVIWLLAAAALVSVGFGEWTDAGAIAVVIVLNTLIGFATEVRAVRSMEALRRLGVARATVRRDGRLLRVPARELVPGDIVVLEAGDVAAADIRLISARRVECDESLLTGESLPVAKRTEPVAGETILAERTDMVYRGTALTRGVAEGVVVATGMATELGGISALVERAAAEETTPLQERLDRLAYRLIWLTLAIAAVVTGLGIIDGKPVFLMIETGIALAVAAIPEGLPIVATIALSRGMWRMARHNALINRLTAVETLGGTSVICTDKTGTLTENRLSVASIGLASGEVTLGDGEGGAGFLADGRSVDVSMSAPLRTLLEAGVLCTSATLAGDRDEDPVGDPLELALLRVGAAAGLSREALLSALPEVREEPFDPEAKMMATVHGANGRFRIAVKGAPEAVLAASRRVLTETGVEPLTDAARRAWLGRNEALAREGGRILALAVKDAPAPDVPPFAELTLVGLVAFRDPLREGVVEAVARCREAGITVVLVTGDHPATALSVARAAGIVADAEAPVIHGRELGEAAERTEAERARQAEARIFARVTPAQKLDIIALHQARGAVVAMTGDGVNDAPALKKADIGIAMGLRGTEVAREAADMVLRDDSFATIAVAVEGGRVIFANIRAFVFYLLSCNLAEILIVFLAAAANAPLPILPLQILLLNLVTDVFPALALGFGEGEPGVMRRPPRPRAEPIMTRAHWVGIVGYGAMIAAATLAAFAVALLWLGMDMEKAVTVSFTTLAFAQLWHVFNMRPAGSAFFDNAVVRNAYVWGALVLCIALVALAIYLPGLSAVLRLSDPGAMGWVVIVGLSALPWAVGQVLKSRPFGSRPRSGRGVGA